MGEMPLVNIQKAIENGPLIVDLPIKNGGFSIVLLVYQRVFLMGPWEWAIEEFIYIMSY